MEYRVLARKYRPQTFADLVGQDVLVRTLTNAFATGRIAHAFLLTGIRGIGKTTTARIIAKGMNCVGPDGNGGPTVAPCGVCTNCTMVAESRHMDVLEMDAASHTGVDDIRDLIGTVQYLPASARMKVYIIDEVHMLSNNAFNALLKTLEEPPPHVKFIFATTEIRKIPVTILSRCQRFDLRRVETPLLASHLKNIAAKESISISEEALTLVADAAEGSVRDALSLLDQAIAMGADESGSIGGPAVRDMLGMNDKSQLFTLLDKLLAGAIAEAMTEFSRLYAAGADPAMMLQDLLALVHYVTRIRITPAAADDLAFSEKERQLATDMAGKLAIPTLTRLWQMLLKGLQEVRIAPEPAASAEMVLVRIAHSAELPAPADLIRTIRKEATNTTPLPPGGSRPSAASLITTQQAAPQPMTIAQAQPAQAPMPQTFEGAVQLFQTMREPLLYNHLMRNVQLVQFEKGRIELNASPETPKDLAGKVGSLLTEWTGQRWMVVLSREAGALPLQQQQEAAEAVRRESVKSHPLVASVLEAFPGATVSKVTDKP